MALLQPKLSLKVAQRQVLTPGLMQMVSVLALNKLELKEMIDAEMVENPVLEEIDERFRCWMRLRAARSGWSARGEEAAAPAPRTSSRRSILARTSRTISTPAIARSRSMKRAKSPRLKTFSPSLRLCPITWRGSWEL
jgi:DNA-directed RNA polymerase specialized sigma54-like protein